MRTCFRHLILWLLALALPVQAVAGVAMAHCGPSHERMRASPAEHHRAHAVDAARSAKAAGAHRHHGADPSHAADAVTPQPHEAAHGDQLTDLGQYKCSSCASCCAGYALLSVMPRVPRPEPAAADFVAVAVSVAPFASGGPDRPPRPLRA